MDEAERNEGAITPLKPFAELYVDSRKKADSILAGINEHFDTPFTLLMVATYIFIAMALWDQGRWIWSGIFYITSSTQMLRVSLKHGLRWWLNHKIKKELKALQSFKIG